METLGLRLILSRKMGTDFNVNLPAWLGDQLGELLVLNFDGEMVTICPAVET